VDREVPVPVGEGVTIVVERDLEARTLEPGDRTSHIGDFENRFKPSNQPSSGHQLQLAVPLTIQPCEAVVADRLVRVRPQPDPPIDRRRAARALHRHVRRWYTDALGLVGPAG
jgi:hypothetical protein